MDAYQTHAYANLPYYLRKKASKRDRFFDRDFAKQVIAGLIVLSVGQMIASTSEPNNCRLLQALHDTTSSSLTAFDCPELRGR